METSQFQKQLALDTNVLLDLAAGAEFAHNFKEVFQGKGYRLRVPPTALAEIHEQMINGTIPEKRVLARLALAHSVRDWDILPLALSTLETDIAERLADKFLERGLLPDSEYNDARILAETALAGVPLLITSDKHLLDMDEDELALAFSEADVSPTHPVHPKALLRALR